MEIVKPRQTILVSTRGNAEVLSKKIKKDNIFTLSWHTPVSFEPFLYAISISPKRFSYKLIKESGVFCVNFISKDLKKQALFCGSQTGEHMDKFKETKLTKGECSKIDCPSIKESLGCLECEVINEIEGGDHLIIIGKVLNICENKKGKRLFQTKGRTFTTTVG
ncbi:flavin reductase family protein [Nanoarchaeota archaeon]